MHRPKYSRGQGVRVARQETAVKPAKPVDVLIAPEDSNACNSPSSPTIVNATKDAYSKSNISAHSQCSDNKRSDDRDSIEVEPRKAARRSEVSKKFGISFKGLKQIFPADARSRISENQDQCIASKVKPAGARCTRPLGRSCNAAAQLEMLVERLKADDDSFIFGLQDFMRSAMCGRSHKEGACAALQDLLELELADTELGLFRAWLRDLLHIDLKTTHNLNIDGDILSKPSADDIKAEKASVKKSSIPRHSSSEPAPSISQSPSSHSRQGSSYCRLQKRKASTLVPPTEPKKIYNHGIQQEHVSQSLSGKMSPIVLSPTEATYDSPSEDEEVFDKILDGGSGSRADSSTVTPLTPPTSSGITMKAEATTPESPLERKSGNLVLQVERSHITAEDDYFKPRKIFRNTTFEMQNILKTTVKSGDSQYSQEIDIDFRVRRSVRLARARDDVKQSSFSRSTSGSLDAMKSERANVLGSTTIVMTETVSRSIVSRTPAEKLLEHIIPFEVQQRLVDEGTICVASLQDERLTRCTNAAKRFSKRKPAIHLDDIDETPREALGLLGKYREDEEPESLLNHVENFIKQALCGSHAAPARKRLQFLDAWLKDSAVSDSRRTFRSSQLNSQAFVAWIKAISSPQVQSIKRDQKVAAAAKPSTSHKRQIERDLTVIPDPVPRVIRFRGEHFEPWQPGTTRQLSINEALRQAAKKPLNPSECKPGFIYVFWLRGMFGLVKIGRTKNPSQRLKQWDKQCQREHEYHGACYDAEMIENQIAHVSRVEILMHTQLKDVRFQNRCQCSVVHREWFQDTEEHVLKTFLKWRDWIGKEPYVQNSDGSWTLKPEFEKSLDEVCKPLEEEKSATSSKNRRRYTPRRKSAPRRQSQE